MGMNERRAAPVVHHGGGVGPVLGRGVLLEHGEGGVALEAELRHKLGARVDARVEAVPAIVVVVAVAPARIRCVNAPPAQAEALSRIANLQSCGRTISHTCAECGLGQKNIIIQKFGNSTPTKQCCKLHKAVLQVEKCTLYQKFLRQECSPQEEEEKMSKIRFDFQGLGCKLS